MLRSGSIISSFLYKYVTMPSSNKEEKIGLNDSVRKLRCLTSTLEGYGGVLAKLSQTLSLNDKDSSVFSECKPFSKEKTIDFFKEYSKILNIEIDYNVYKSGSVGQVHKAVYKGVNIIFKVQYVGLSEQTKIDLGIMDTITSCLFHFTDLKNAIADIRTKIKEELDYNLEAENQKKMFELYINDTDITIPQIIPELSSDKVLCMNFINGRSLENFISNSTQEERNKLSLCAIKFVFKNIYLNGILYSDLHYGNLLVMDDSTLCVLDFGCLHDINDELKINLVNLHKSIKNGNKDSFYKIVEDIGIIDKNISSASKDYIYEYFCIQYEPWISKEFEFTEEWLDISTDKNTELMKEWKLPKNMVYFNKIPYGFAHVLTKLKFKGNLSEVFDDIFKNLNY
jgi:predicted unusual protein kinase regulating ubiquinone biosynthesis (AarF/ABC1/UbiB family)